jgi:hypothetical protein
MTLDEIDRVRHDGPQSLTDAQIVRNMFASSATSAMATISRDELQRAIAEVSFWSMLMPAALVILRLETRRRLTEAHGTITFPREGA